ncbi:efflux RND transporter periplasmic adaptor subunit [Mangrovicoccus sp. HB161399]|uniref:efflux RND transporter periplasmic adaptor subunit n=1 Tax=Mangrovicoccus sp. HB161399 TaxID=2720392 RepID=UPI00155580E4|nr:efflux RND transporter periplasmic adaptor subunit [Mangrovicoccus sp. HB161399]
MTACRILPALPLLAFLLISAAPPGRAGTLALEPFAIAEWKSVYATVEPRQSIPARARIGGTVEALSVVEGDRVAAGAAIGRIVDEKLDFQLAGVEAQLAAAQSQLENARNELTRGEALVERGVSTAQRLDALRTQVDVAEGQIRALEAEKARVAQMQAEGGLLAPADGLVLTVPVAAGEVVMAGEAVATVGTGGFFLRLSLPEHYADGLAEGDTLMTGEGNALAEGRIARVYPQITAGRVEADIEVPGLAPRFAGARVAVRVPVGTRDVLAVPEAALAHRGGLDFVMVDGPDGPAERAVLPGGSVTGADGAALTEIVSGLAAGDVVVTPDE